MRISYSSSDVCSSDLSFVNLGASLVAFRSLRWAEQPPDDDHAYGHDKAEYFSSGFEGALVFIAALAIIYTAWPRLLDPQPLDRPGIGLAISVLAADRKSTRLNSSH